MRMMTNGNFINNITFAIPRIVVTIKCGNEVNLLFFLSMAHLQGIPRHDCATNELYLTDCLDEGGTGDYGDAKKRPQSKAETNS